MRTSYDPQGIALASGLSDDGAMDINTLAKSIVDQATGDKPKKKIQPDTAKRGHARAAALTDEERHTIAKKAADTRWKRKTE
jgi:hypothetical protein